MPTAPSPRSATLGFQGMLLRFPRVGLALGVALGSPIDMPTHHRFMDETGSKMTCAVGALAWMVRFQPKPRTS
jgi:hypothetical protein